MVSYPGGTTTAADMGKSELSEWDALHLVAGLRERDRAVNSDDRTAIELTSETPVTRGTNMTSPHKRVA